MHRHLLTLIIICIACSSYGAATRTGLRAAMSVGMVKVSAVSTGASYHGKALKLQVINTTRNALQITVDPALIFRPLDSGYQDLVLPAEETFVLAPGSTSDLVVQTFCGKAHAMAPGDKLTYIFRKQGDSNLIKVTQFIRKAGLYDDLGQQAVWVMTDNHSLTGVIDADRAKLSSDLLALLVKLTGRPAPEYFKVYKLGNVAGQPVFEQHVLKIIAHLDWQLETPKSLTLGIYNSRGDQVEGIFEDKYMTRGKFKMLVQFQAENAPPGKYYMRLYEGMHLMKEIKVVVD